MSDLPKISIALVTYKRTAEALETIRSTAEKLDYPKELRTWVVSDDGSDPEHFEAVTGAILNAGETILWSESKKYRPGTYFCGMGWNKALGIAHQNSDFVLWLEDDWRLATQFPLAPYVKLLQDRDDVGIVTFRILSVNAAVRTVGFDGRIYLDYDRTTQYAYSGNPHLRHARYTKHYGWFGEELSPGEIELKFDDKYRLDVNNGPRIWRPVDIDPWGAWHHIGTEKTWR